jgi:hypothetical protein
LGKIFKKCEIDHTLGIIPLASLPFICYWQKQTHNDLDVKGVSRPAGEPLRAEVTDQITQILNVNDGLTAAGLIVDLSKGGCSGEAVTVSKSV